jgi:hypothetical protein
MVLPRPTLHMELLGLNVGSIKKKKLRSQSAKPVEVLGETLKGEDQGKLNQSNLKNFY